MMDFVKKPTLVLNVERVKRNIRRMKDKADRSGVILRPHFKTHQSAEIGEFFREAGVAGITVSSVSMAEFFASRGWKDITIAFPVNLREIEEIAALAGRISLNLLVESEESAALLASRLSQSGASDSPGTRAGVYLKIDTGYGRTGIPVTDVDKAASVASVVAKSPALALRGLLTHAGHTYEAPSLDAVRTIYRETAVAMNGLRDELLRRGFGGLKLSAGDTPGCSIVERFDGIDEVRPGNFVFYDAKQLSVGSCGEGDIGLAVACPVVAKHPERGEVLIYGGAVHLSKDYYTDAEGRRIYGRIALPAKDGWGPLRPDCRVSFVSQEHGRVSVGTEVLEKLRIGDLIMVIPAHSCLAADLLGVYYSPCGERIGSVFRKQS
jgi:D-serine deaminase-like pyridoxal phosphate-dependent protein